MKAMVSQAAPRSTARTAAVVFAGFCAFVTLFAPQPLLPMLAREFRVSAAAISLVVTASTLAVAMAAPLCRRGGRPLRTQARDRARRVPAGRADAARGHCPEFRTAAVLAIPAGRLHAGHFRGDHRLHQRRVGGRRGRGHGGLCHRDGAGRFQRARPGRAGGIARQLALGLRHAGHAESVGRAGDSRVAARRASASPARAAAAPWAARCCATFPTRAWWRPTRSASA